MDSPLIFTVLLILFLVVLFVVITIVLIYKYFSLKSQMVREIQEKRETWRKKELEPTLKEQAETVRREAQEQLQKWREQEVESIRQQQLEVARKEALVQLEKWKKGEEKEIRQDAIQRSRSVTVGKVTEHIVPYLPDFVYNPKDARFIGSPVDLLVFDGLADGNVKGVIFIEVKTGKSSLSTRERKVRDAIKSGKVHWIELRPKLDSPKLVKD